MYGSGQCLDIISSHTTSGQLQLLQKWKDMKDMVNKNRMKYFEFHMVRKYDMTEFQFLLQGLHSSRGQWEWASAPPFALLSS